MSPTGWQLAEEATGLRSGEGVYLCSSMPWVHHCPLHPDGFVVFACIPFFSIHHPDLVPLGWAHQGPPLASLALLILGIYPHFL